MLGCSKGVKVAAERLKFAMVPAMIRRLHESETFSPCFTNAAVRLGCITKLLYNNNRQINAGNN